MPRGAAKPNANSSADSVLAACVLVACQIKFIKGSIGDFFGEGYICMVLSMTRSLGERWATGIVGDFFEVPAMCILESMRK